MQGSNPRDKTSQSTVSQPVPSIGGSANEAAVSAPSGNIARQAVKDNRHEQATLNEDLISRFTAVPTQFNASGEKVAVMFIDLVGSTAYKYGRTEVQGIAKAYEHNRIADKAIGSVPFLGITVKLLGDGLMAYFDGADCCKRALACALNIIESFDKHNSAVPNWKDHIITRVGICHGPVWFFRFEQSTNLDPLGPTVDLAKRLCDIAPDMNVVATEQTVELAGGKSEFPNSKGPQDRHLKGIPHSHRLFTVTTGARAVSEIALSGSIRPNPDNIQQHIDHAKKYIDQGDYTKAKNSFAAAIHPDLDPRNFDANVGMAEMLALRDANGGLNTEERLDLAYQRLCAVKTERPSSYVWMLLAWVQYRRFRIVLRATKSEAAAKSQEAIRFLSEAVKFAEQARAIADGHRESYGSACARVYLIVYLCERVRLRLGNEADDLQRADRYKGEVLHILDKGLGEHIKSNFLAGQALILLARDGTGTNGVRKLLAEALQVDPNSAVAAAVLNELNSP